MFVYFSITGLAS